MQRSDSALDCKAVLLASIGGIALLTACGGDGDQGPTLPAPGPGVVFTYPYDGQQDVPTGARIVVSFTDPVDAAALSATVCSMDDDGNVAGAFCVLGPSGLLPNTATMAGTAGNVIHFQSEDLEPGTTYEVYVAPSLLAQGAVNVPADGPLFTFRTRQARRRLGEPPVVLAINGEDPAAFIAGSGVTPRFPVVDFVTLRVLFSEPIDPASVIPGVNMALVEVGQGGEETAVNGTLLVQGQHLAFDPDTDLTAGATYRLRLSDGIRDANGEPLAAAEYELSPQSSLVEGERIVQTLDNHPAAGDPESPATSPLTGAQANAIQVASPLIGENTIEIKNGTLHAEMGNPGGFEKLIPLTIRKGHLLETTGLDVALGGQIPIGIQTGDIQIRFLSDATGYLTRNPYRDPDQIPDDARAPAFLYLSFDIAVSASDPVGNAVLNQTILNVQLAGTATTIDGALFIEAVGAMELDLLGAATVPANLVHSLRTAPGELVPTDTAGPTLVATYPADEQDEFPVTDRILLTFSEPMAVERLAPEDLALTTEGGTAVEFDVYGRGSMVVISPRQPLAYGTTYTLGLNSPIEDMAGNRWDPPSSELGDDAALVFATPFMSDDALAPPLLTAVLPGAPCALEGATAETSGRCAASEDDDALYVPFQMPANRDLVVEFSAPMDPATLVLGDTCDTGTVRVEVLADGTCTGTVPGSFLVRERSIRFEPTEPWSMGQVYRLVLIPGGDDQCDANEICGQNGMPLNTDALNGTVDDEGGGPRVDIVFTAVPATRETLLPLATEPITDVNGNGFVDAGELPNDASRVAMVITDTGGIVTDASFDQDDCIPGTPDTTEACMYLAASLPASVGEPQTDCTIGTDEAGQPVVVPRCIPVRVYPQILYGTSLTMDANAIGLPVINNLGTGRMVLRLREEPTVPIIGYIIDSDTGQAQFTLNTNLYMDAPDMSILGGLASHDMQSKPLSTSLVGPVTTLPDGRIQLDLANTAAVDVQVNVSFLAGGSISMQIPEGELKLRLVGQPHERTRR